MNEKKDSMVNSSTKELEAFVSETIADVVDGKKVDCEANRPTHYIEYAASELQAVEEAHEKRVAEKNQLILTLQSKSSMAKVKQINFNHFFYKTYCRM